MNILHLSKYYYPRVGGIELVAKMMVKAQTESGHSVSVIAFDQHEKTETGIFDETILRIRQNFFFLSTPFNFSIFKKFRKIVLEKKINRIYVHLPNPLMHELVRLNARFLKDHGIDVVGIYHSDIVNQKYLAWLYHTYFLFSSKVYDYFLCSSQELWDSSPVLTSIPSQKKVIIPFCSGSEYLVRKKQRFEGKLLAVGRMVPYKGYEFLINSLKGTPYQLTIVGDGPLKHKLKKISSQNIKFLHGISEEEKQKVFQDTDLLIVGSINRAEAFGMTIVEAFQMGIPVVASQINTGVTYLVKDGERGFTFPVLNKEKFLNCLEKYKMNPELILNHSENAKKFFGQELDYHHFKERLETFDSIKQQNH